MPNTPVTVTLGFMQRVKESCYHMLSGLFGVSKGAFDVVAPILAHNVGSLMAQAVPMALPMVISAVASKGKIDNDTRDQMTSQMTALLQQQAVTAGVQLTDGLVKYFIDTAYHSAKAQNMLPATATSTATVGTATVG